MIQIEFRCNMSHILYDPESIFLYWCQNCGWVLGSEFSDEDSHKFVGWATSYITPTGFYSEDSFMLWLDKMGREDDYV